jgi:S-formylglutathione hydrolase FrmB
VRIGLRQVSRVRTGRLITLALRSAAMGDVQSVDVLLPARYDASGHTRYHALWLLHGAGGDYRSWIQQGIERELGGLPVIAVMPSGSVPGLDGDYTDWSFHSSGAPAPGWESYHMRELLPFIDAHFPILPGPSGHAIAGISMGGGGATKYAAQYPGTFGYVATFSGEADPLLPLALSFQTPNCRWGSPAVHPALWRGNDSTDLAGNLRGVRVFIRSGTGRAGPFDGPAPPPRSVAGVVWGLRLAIEYGAHLENEDFVRALSGAGVTAVDVRFFPGSHFLPYWQRDTHELVAWLRASFRRPVRTPATISVRSIARSFSAWGWSFTVRRNVTEFLYVGVHGSTLTLTGSGQVSVSTPGTFTHGVTYVVSVGGHRRHVRADQTGALRFRVGLGPSHIADQTQFGPGATQGWRRARAVVVGRAG